MNGFIFFPYYPLVFLGLTAVFYLDIVRCFIDLSLMHDFDKTSILNISTSYYKNNSNQDAYVYDEKIISLKYLKAFSW
jgi:hypothetical protein